MDLVVVVPPDLNRHTLFSSRPGDEDEKAAVLVTASYAHSMVGGPWFLGASEGLMLLGIP